MGMKTAFIFILGMAVGFLLSEAVDFILYRIGGIKIEHE